MEIQYVQQEIKKEVSKPAKHCNNIPSKIKQEIGSYALINRTKAAIDRFSKVYTKHSLKRITVNGWKERCMKNDLHSIGNRGRPNLVNDEGILREFGGSLKLTEGWARNVLKGMDRVKRKGTTEKVEPCPKFLEDEKFTFQRSIPKFVSDHDIPLELVLNLDQIPFFYVSPRKYAFDLKGSKTVQIKGVEDKRQITATFAVTASGSLLPIQLIYSGETKCRIPKYDFPSCFNVTFTPNHWSNYEKCVRLFKKIIFLYLKAKKEMLGYPNE